MEELWKKSQAVLWQDSCDQEELKKILSSGGSVEGVTSNPSLVWKLVQKKPSYWSGLLKKVEDEDEGIRLIQKNIFMDLKKSFQNLLDPQISVQVSMKFWNSPEKMIAEGEFWSKLGFLVKLPCTEEGAVAAVALAKKGARINGTLCFSVHQALLFGEALKDWGSSHYVSVLLGKIDDAVSSDLGSSFQLFPPESYLWAGVAIFKKIYKIFEERKIPLKLVAASYRHQYHGLEILGPHVVTTLPPLWRQRFQSMAMANSAAWGNSFSINQEIDPQILKILRKNSPLFCRLENENCHFFPLLKEGIMNFLKDEDHLRLWVRDQIFYHKADNSRVGD